MNTINAMTSYDPVCFSVKGSQEQKAEKVAEEFESLFINQLLKEMDKTVDREESDIFHSEAENIYRGFFYQEIAREVAHNGGVGIKELVMETLEGQENQQ